MVLPQTDEELMRAYVAGDDASADVLFDRYAGSVYSLMNRYVRNPEQARDLCQQAFLQIHRARHDWDPSRAVKPWLFTVAVNVRRDWHRRHVRRPQGHSVGEAPLEWMPTDGGQEAASEAIRLRNAVGRLPEPLREVIELHWFEGFPMREIAEMSGLSHSAIKVRAHRAYKLLRTELGDVADG